VNTVKDGIEWEWGDYEFPCLDGLPFSGYASLQDLERQLATALASAGPLAVENRSTILLTSFLPLLVKAASLARPEFQVEATAGGRDVVLSEASTERGSREVARQPLSENARRIAVALNAVSGK
jgi:hypothetical protein